RRAPPPPQPPRPPAPPRAEHRIPPPPPPQPPRRPRRQLGDLLGPRAFAWTGGIVTLLGIVLLFVLAVDRGWIGPGARIGIGALASASVFVAGIWLRRRYGDTHAALAAAGAGIAGGYATLLAAAAVY